MVDFEIKFIDNKTKMVTLPDLLPRRVGRLLRRSLNVSAETKQGKVQDVKIENMGTLLTDMQDIIVDNFLKEYLSEQEYKDLSMESADEVLEFYWSQLQGELKKKTG
jgi:hypothetical protein